MKKVPGLIGLTGLALMVIMASGCRKEQDQAAAPKAAAEEMEKAAPAAEHPDTAKPKDHPAH